MISSSLVGPYTVTYDVNDFAGNQAQQVVRTVVVFLPPAQPQPPIGISFDEPPTFPDGFTTSNTFVETPATTAATNPNHLLYR